MEEDGFNSRTDTSMYVEKASAYVDKILEELEEVFKHDVKDVDMKHFRGRGKQRHIEDVDLEDVRDRAKEIVKEAREDKDYRHSGKRPQGIAAGSLYFAFVDQGGWITQREIAEASEVSQNTVRKRCRYQELRKYSDSLIEK